MKLLFLMMFALAQIIAAQVPTGYTTVYQRDFETNLKLGEYLKTDAWYFYWGGAGASTWSHAELDKRFQIKADPAGTDKALYMIKFDGDKDYANQNLNPRTELSYRPSVERSTSKEIFFRIRTWFPKSQKGVFAAEFIQFWLHGPSNIPLQVEVRNGAFDARWPGKFITPLTNGARLENNLERWITWEARAKFTNNGGYWTLYMDGKEVFHYNGALTSEWPTTSGTWHPQHGIYSNNGGAGNMECFFDDFLVAEKAGTVTSSSSQTVSSSSDAPVRVQVNDVKTSVTTRPIYDFMGRVQSNKNLQPNLHFGQAH